MKNKIYWSSIEFKYDKDSPDSENLAGGFVYVFIKAFDVMEALLKIQYAFKERKLTPIEIEHISPYNPELQWENEDDKKKYNELSEFASQSGIVEFDDFYSFESKNENE